ncbi:hypothetical protein LXL04_027441 [Taraxacum kok-saghyz]
MVFSDIFSLHFHDPCDCHRYGREDKTYSNSLQVSYACGNSDDKECHRDDWEGCWWNIERICELDVHDTIAALSSHLHKEEAQVIKLEIYKTRRKWKFHQNKNQSIQKSTCEHLCEQVKLTEPPTTKARSNQLKKVDICAASFGYFSSNWSAPCDGNAAFTPEAPTAIRESVGNSDHPVGMSRPLNNH